MGNEPVGRGTEVVILQVAGEFDASNLPRFCSKVNGLFREGIRRIVLDLEELRFADSEMLGQLQKVRKRFRDHGGDVVLLRPGPLVRRVIEVLGLDELLAIHESQTEAIRALAPRATRSDPDAAGREACRITRVG